MSAYGQNFPVPRDQHSHERQPSDPTNTTMSGSGVPMPMGAHNRAASGQYGMGTREYGSGMGAFIGARSPPKSKSTSHVPCRFYPIGQCQAGAACQFSHDLDPTTQNAPCKYFAKGSCKFGQNCALAHVLPDGRVINRPPRGASGFNRRSAQSNAAINGPPSSLLSIQANDPMAQPESHLVYPQQEMVPAYSQASVMPTIGGDYQHADWSSPYGSPHGDGRLATSPRQGLSALDAPMPKSFDSQGISLAARHGPFASSVPSRFGLESPPASLPHKAQIGNTALRDSTFGDTPNLDGVLHGLGSSPRENTALDFSKRPLHSERFARSRPMMMSSSLDVRSSRFHADASESDASTDDGVGEDLLPSSLHDLLPQDRLRRPSRNAPDDDSGFLTPNIVQRRAVSNGEGKVGSLSPHSGSPSRYSSIWAARSNNAPKTDADANSSLNLGHVGSPLRPSSLRTSSMTFSPSPKRHPDIATSMLTSQLRGTKISENSKTPTPQTQMHPGTTKTASNSSNTPVGRSGLGDRGFSSSSLGREKIDEEAMFSFEEDGEGPVSMPTEDKSSFENGSSVAAAAAAAGGLGRGRNGGFAIGKGAATLGPIGDQRSK